MKQSLVEEPGRSVDKLTNCVDLFQLFGEIAGVDVRKVVPSTHILDSAPVLARLPPADARAAGVGDH